MTESADLLQAFVKSLSHILLTIFATKQGLLVFATLLLCALAIKVAQAVQRARFTAEAADRRFGGGSAFLVVLESLGTQIARIAVSVPTLLAVVAASVAIVAAGSSIEQMDQFVRNERRIQELIAVVKNLQRRVRIADVRALEVKDGTSRLLFMYYDPSDPSSVSQTQEITIQGTDIYFDAIVLNFKYSAIETGVERNIAIPFKVFSDVVPESDGIALSAVDSSGVPLAFKRADDEIYGIAPADYRARLAEFVQLVRTDEAARAEGIVRSLYGSALHKRLSTGDRIELWLEESGGMTLRERFSF